MGSDTPCYIQAGVLSLPITWPRADKVALAAFDPATKVCDHRCTQSLYDPRSEKECLYLCDLCGPEGKRQDAPSHES